MFLTFTSTNSSGLSRSEDKSYGRTDSKKMDKSWTTPSLFLSVAIYNAFHVMH